MDDSTKAKKLIKGVGIYGIGTFGTKILSFLIVPLYTYYITTSDMGVYDILISTVHLLTPLVTMQISDAAYKWILQNEDESSIYVRATMQVLVFNCAVASALIMLVNRFYAIPYCGWFISILVLSRAFQTVQKILRGLKRQKLFAAAGILYTAIFLSLNIVQIVVLRQGVVSLFQSMAAAYLITTAVMFVCEPRLRVSLMVRPDMGIITKLLRFSIPLVPNYLNWWIINSSDRYIVAFFLGTSATGILAVAHKFPTALQTVLNLFNSAWQDVSIADARTGTGEYYTKVFRRYACFALSLLWFLIPVSKILMTAVLNVRYRSGCDYVAFYYMGTVFQSFSSFYGVGYLRSDRTGKAFSTSIFGAVVNAVINIMFVRLIGIQAAAVSTFAAFFLMWLVRERQNREELGISVRWPMILSLTAAGVIVSVASILCGIRINALLTAVGAAGFLFFNRDNIAMALKFLRGKLGKGR